MQRRIVRQGLPRMLGLPIALFLVIFAAFPQPTQAATGTYRNPLNVRIPGDGRVESCADPSTFRAEDGYWYTYCTSDPLNDEDRTASGGFNFRLIPQLRSRDLVNWTYVGDAFTSRPAYATPDAGIWAPEIEYYPERPINERYHLYYVVTNTTFAGGGSAIGVATSGSPTGPWTHRATPVVEPHPADCCPGSRRWVFDPEVFRTNGPDYIYFGSYFGGISVRELSEDGFTTSPSTQSNVAVANKFEGPEVIYKDGYYYLFLSATDCCRGPLTGYSVFVGRADNPRGPFLDREGVDLNDNEGPNEADPTDGRVGGTPVITPNGNRWVGPGHNTVFMDFDGQWWTIYHAIDQREPYFEGGVNIFGGGCGPEDSPAVPDRCGDLNKRPMLLDPIDWRDGWPVLNGGRGPSDNPQQAPAAQPGEKTNYKAKFVRQDQPGRLIEALSDEFNGELGSQWQWIRQPSADTYGVNSDGLRFNTQRADLFVTNNSASVLTEPAPNGNFMVETRVRLDVPPEGCCFNYAQAGLVIYGDDDNFIKLTHVSIFNTRQTEFAKEIAPVPAGYPRYGNTVVGPPNEWTYLRIVARQQGGQDEYTAYTSRDGTNWVRGGTWTHKLGKNVRIGLVSMGQEANDQRLFTATFDYVRVYKLNR